MDPLVHLIVKALYICFYPILRFYPDLYYPLVKFGFAFVNCFRKRHVVPSVNDHLLLLSATDAAAKIRRKELKSFDLISAYFARIKEVNPLINALVSNYFIDAIEEAKRVDQLIESIDIKSDEWSRLEEEKSLLGIPFTVKDSMDVENREITVGITNRRGVISTHDAEVVKRARQAGGILIGTTNVPECLMAFETFNAIFGVTNNPYDSRRSPGGSSGGEGALISACGSLIGIGSDIGGSVRIPAFHSGVFGLKATTGFVPTEGQLPAGFNDEGHKKQMFCVGPITRYIEDISLCLKAFNPEGFKANKLDEDVDIRGIKLYYMEGLQTDCGSEPLAKVQKEKLREVIAFFEKEHQMIVHGVSFFELNEAVEMLMTSVSEGSPVTQFICNDKSELEGSKLFIEIAKSLFGISNHMFNLLIWIFDSSRDRRSEEQKKALARKRDKLRKKILDILDNENAVLLMPTWAHTPAFHGYAVWSLPDVAYTGIWNALSLPALHCPTGLDDSGLPTGIQIIGAPNSERLLLEVGRRVEGFFGGWRAPWVK